MNLELWVESIFLKAGGERMRSEKNNTVWKWMGERRKKATWGTGIGDQVMA